jgi:hypothetical protein
MSARDARNRPGKGGSPISLSKATKEEVTAEHWGDAPTRASRCLHHLFVTSPEMARSRVRAAVRYEQEHPGDKAERRIIGAYDRLVAAEHRGAS